MNMAVNQTGHQCFARAVNHLHVFLLDGLRGDFRDQAVFDIDVLMLLLCSVTDDDVNVIDDILVLFVLFGTGQEFDQ